MNYNYSGWDSLSGRNFSGGNYFGVHISSQSFCLAILWAPIVQGLIIWGKISGIAIFGGQLSGGQLSWWAIVQGAIIRGNCPGGNYPGGNFSVPIWKSKNHLVWCFTHQLQYRNENQIFISNCVFQFIKKMKWHFRYTDCKCLLRPTLYENILSCLN